ncbi:MAG: hypothetical protein U0746_17975 [Gemmataceae bacterium]
MTAGTGGGPLVREYDVNGRPLFGFLAYDPTFRGGTTVAVLPIRGGRRGRDCDRAGTGRRASRADVRVEQRPAAGTVHRGTRFRPRLPRRRVRRVTGERRGVSPTCLRSPRRGYPRDDTMPRLHLTRLEDRAVPAVATWDGGGSDARWTTAVNWANDVAPHAGDDLVFPVGGARLTAANDFAAGTAFGRITISDPRYRIGGNAVALAGGLTIAAVYNGEPTPAQVDLPITLTASQTFTNGLFEGYTLTKAVNLNGHDLTASGNSNFTTVFAGPITGTGNLVVADSSNVELAAANTFTGTTTVLAGSLRLYGSLAGPITLTGSSGTASFNGTGAARAFVVSAGDVNLGPRETDQPGVLTIGPLDLMAGGPSAVVQTTLGVYAAGPSQFRVTGTVRLGGTLTVFNGGRTLRPGESLTLVANDGTDPVVGTFASLPEGAIVLDGAVPLRISYRGGDGNDVTVTGVSRPASAVGAGAGGLPVVNVFDGGGNFVRQFMAYEASFRGGVHVATGEMTGDGVADVVTTPGEGGGPLVRVWDGATGALVRQFLAYDAAFRGGVNLAVAPVRSNSSPYVAHPPDIITGAGPGGGPHVKVFDADGGLEQSFFAYDAGFRGGVNVAGRVGPILDLHGVIVGVGVGLVVTGAGPGGGPHVRIFREGVAESEFLAYEPSFTGGVSVACDSFAVDPTVVTAPGSGGGPLVRVFDVYGVLLHEFLAYRPDFRGGVSVAVAQIGFSGSGVILTGAGAGGGPHVEEWELPTPVFRQGYFAFDPAFYGGIFVG